MKEGISDALIAEKHLRQMAMQYIGGERNEAPNEQRIQNKKLEKGRKTLD